MNGHSQDPRAASAQAAQTPDPASLPDSSFVRTELPAAGRRPDVCRARPLSRTERLTILYGILCVVLILVVLQLWLLTATMNAYLGGDDRIVWPAAAASLACFGLNAGLLWYVYRMER